MAEPVLKLRITDEGTSRVVKRNLDEISNAARGANSTIQMLNATLRQMKQAMPANNSAAAMLQNLARASATTAQAQRNLSSSSQLVTNSLGQQTATTTRTQAQINRLALSFLGLVAAQNAAAASVMRLISLYSTFSFIAGALGLTTVAAGAIAAGDAYRSMDNQLRLVAKSEDNLRAIHDAVYEASQRNRLSVTDMTSLYSKLARAGDVLGTSQTDLMKITEATAQAIQISGGNANTAAGVILQFSQGIGSGLLGGAELVAVLEGAPRLAKAVAEGIMADTEAMKQLGLSGVVTAGDLKKLGSEGKLTGDVVMAAMLKAADGLKEEFSQVRFTVGANFVALKNSIVENLGGLLERTGITQAIGDGLFFIATNIATVGRMLAATAITVATLFAPAIIAAFGAATTAVLGFVAALLLTPLGWVSLIIAGVSWLIAFSDQIIVSSDGMTTLWDVAVVVFQAISNIIGSTVDFILAIFSHMFGTVSEKWEEWGPTVQKVMTTASEAVYEFVNVTIGLIVGLLNSMQAIWNGFPAMIELIFKKAFNAALRIAEGAVNALAGLLNELPGVQIDPVKLKLWDTAKLQKEATDLGKKVSKNLSDAMKVDYIGSVVNPIMAEARLNAFDREFQAMIDKREGKGELSSETGTNLLAGRNKGDAGGGSKTTRESILADTNRELVARRSLIGLLGEERGVREEINKIQDKLEDKGFKKLEGAELARIEGVIRETRALEQLDEARQSIYDNTRGQARILNIEQTALNQLYKEGVITAKEYADQTRDVTIANLQLADTLESRTAAALLQIQQKMAEAPKRLEEAMVSAFENIQGRLEQFKIDMAAVQALFDAGKISIEQYSSALQDIQIEDLTARMQQGTATFLQGIDLALNQWAAKARSASAQVASFMVTALEKVGDGFANAVGRAIVYSEDLGAALLDVARSAIAELIGSLIKLGIQWLIQATLGTAIQTAATAASTAMAGAVATAWAPAAAAVSLASYGANAGPAMAGIAATYALTAALSSVGGAVGGSFSDAGTPVGGSTAFAAEGGLIRGAGTGTSDSIPARLSNGEFVVRAAAARNNLALLTALNEGRLTSMAEGGPVGMGLKAMADAVESGSTSSVVSPAINAEINISIEGGGENPQETADKVAKKVRDELSNLVLSVIQREQKPGGTLANRRKEIG